MADPYPFLFIPDMGSGSESEPNPPPLPSFDLFRRRPLSPPTEPPGFLTLGFAFSDQEEEEVGRDWTGDEFFNGRRSPGPDDPASDFSRARLIDEDALRILGLDSSDDDDKQIVAIGPRTTFHCRHGKAYLFNKVFKVTGPDGSHYWISQEAQVGGSDADDA